MGSSRSSGSPYFGIAVAVNGRDALHDPPQHAAGLEIRGFRRYGGLGDQSFHHGPGALDQAGDRIAALEDEGGPGLAQLVREPADDRRHRAEPLFADLHRGEGVVAVGAVAPVETLRALGLRAAEFPFRHGALYAAANRPWLADSYHCSRYNTNTGRLTEAMFHDVFAAVRRRLDAAG